VLRSHLSKTSMPAESSNSRVLPHARRIRVHVPDSAIVILSSHQDQQFIEEARKAGANGYVEKSGADQQLIRAIESTVKGEEFFLVEQDLRQANSPSSTRGMILSSINVNLRSQR
jgi:DNA-binding NarL/FixJ family response regulator